MSGFALHPDAFTDLDDIWEFIAADSVAAADRLAAEIFETLRGVTETDPTILRFPSADAQSGSVQQRPANGG